MTACEIYVMYKFMMHQCMCDRLKYVSYNEFAYFKFSGVQERCSNSSGSFPIEFHGSDERSAAMDIDGQGSARNTILRTLTEKEKVFDFLSSLRVDHGMSENAITWVTSQVQSMVAGAISELRARPELKQPTVTSELNRVSIKGRLGKAIKQTTPYIPPEMVQIDAKEHSIEVHFIPVTKQLQCFVLNQVIEVPENQVSITLYADEFGTTDPLRGKVSRHKLFGLYFRVETAEASSKPDGIQLIQLCKSGRKIARLVESLGTSADRFEEVG